MAETTVAERIKELIVDELGCNPKDVVPEAKLREDLGADSLDAIEMTMRVEEEFEVEIPDDDAEKLQTVGDIVRYVEQQIEIKA